MMHAGTVAILPFRNMSGDPAPRRVKEAEAALAKVFELQPDFGPAYVDATYPFRDPAHTATFTEGLRKAGWSG
jgi:hypothetical protein